MMKVLELMMMKNGLLKIMLTVLKHNEVASKFFKDVLKYEIDETCPYDSVYEQFDYEILSRWVHLFTFCFYAPSVSNYFSGSIWKRRRKGKTKKIPALEWLESTMRCRLIELQFKGFWLIIKSDENMSEFHINTWWNKGIRPLVLRLLYK